MPDYIIKNVYQLGDFSTSGGNITPPDEQGARAQGNPPFNIELNPGAAPFSITITDSDTLFHETRSSDPLQELAEDVTIDGVLYTAGSHVVLNYVLSTNGGFLGYSITIGSTNSGGNTTTAFITPEPLVPGQQYVFTSEGNIGRNNPVPYANFVCFTAGSTIDTPDGPRAIDRLQPGDLVCTRDAGAMPVQWIGQRRVLAAGPLAPVEFAPGSLGNTSPMRVSAQHRMLIEGPAAELLTGHPEVVVHAKHLVDNRNARMCPGGMVHYVHLALAAHHLVRVDGVWSETLLVCDGALSAMTPAQQAELAALFPAATIAPGQHARLCRPGATAHEARALAAQIWPSPARARAA